MLIGIERQTAFMKLEHTATAGGLSARGQVAFDRPGPYCLFWLLSMPHWRVASELVSLGSVPTTARAAPTLPHGWTQTSNSRRDSMAVGIDPFGQVFLLRVA